MKKEKTLITVYNSIFIVLCIILGFLGRLAVLPVFPFLKLDFSDIPVFLITLICGIPSGITVLLVSSLLRTLMFSSSGWMGFVIRSTSIVMVLFMGWFGTKKIKPILKIFGIGFGMILCLTIKLISNYIIWTNFFSLSKELINTFMMSLIIPYNVLKIFVTVAVAFWMEKPARKIMQSSR